MKSITYNFQCNNIKELKLVNNANVNNKMIYSKMNNPISFTGNTNFIRFDEFINKSIGQLSIRDYQKINVSAEKILKKHTSEEELEQF